MNNTFEAVYNEYKSNSSLVVGLLSPLAMSGGFPIDIDSVKLTLRDLENYANASTQSAHPGKLVTVVNDGDNNGVYVINKVARYDGEGSVTKLLDFNRTNVSKLFEIVDTLPDVGESNLIYLIYNEDKAGFNQYVWKNNSFQNIGFLKISLDQINTSGELLKLFDNSFFVEWINLTIGGATAYNLDQFVKPGLYFIYGITPITPTEFGFPTIPDRTSFTAYLQVINGNSNIDDTAIYNETCKQIISFNFSETIYTRIGIKQNENLAGPAIYGDNNTIPKYTFDSWVSTLNTSDVVETFESAAQSKPLSSLLGRSLKDQIQTVSMATCENGVLTLNLSITNGTNS